MVTGTGRSMHITYYNSPTPFESRYPLKPAISAFRGNSVTLQSQTPSSISNGNEPANSPPNLPVHFGSLRQVARLASVLIMSLALGILPLQRAIESKVSEKIMLSKLSGEEKLARLAKQHGISPEVVQDHIRIGFGLQGKAVPSNLEDVFKAIEASPDLAQLITGSIRSMCNQRRSEAPEAPPPSAPAGGCHGGGNAQRPDESNGCQHHAQPPAREGGPGDPPGDSENCCEPDAA